MQLARDGGRMKPSTALQVMNVAMALGMIIVLGIVWSPWASVLVFATNLASVGLDSGVKSLQAGGE